MAANRGELECSAEHILLLLFAANCNPIGYYRQGRAQRAVAGAYLSATGWALALAATAASFFDAAARRLRKPQILTGVVSLV